MFQRTIPGFEPSPESFAISAEALQNVADWLESAGSCGQENLDLFTAIGTGLAAQQISNDPGGDRWLRLIDDAAERYLSHVQPRTKAKTPKRKGTR